MKKIILLIIILGTLQNLNAQQDTKFGLNCIYDDSALNRLISRENNKIIDFSQAFHISFLRFPGGTIGRTYFWDRQDLIPKASQLYSDFLSVYTKPNTNTENNTKKANYYGNRADKANPPLLGDSLYSLFLKFCNKQSIIPIIQLNSWYYHDDNNVYKIANEGLTGVDNAKWNLILENIKKQIQFSHKFIGQVYWEIGNEDQHVYSANLYAGISERYATIVKSLYPNDKVIVTYANPTSKDVEVNWNKDMINCLVKANSIKLIDFVAPHYYSKAFEDGEVIQTSADLQKRIKKVDIYSKSELLQEPIRSYSSIKVFYTEFGIFKKVSQPNYNTQTHAIMMLYYLMSFNATPNIYGTIMHSFTTKSTGFLFDPSSFGSLNYNFSPADAPTNSFFKYIPPQAKAEKLFYDNNPVKAQSLVVNDTYAYTVGNIDGRIIINVLNFSTSALNLKLSDIVNFNQSSKINVIKYQFDDLNSHQWNYSVATSQSSVNKSMLSIPQNSYSVITIQK